MSQLACHRARATDAFADPFELAPGVPVTADTGAASAEPGEPAHDGLRASRSVWAAWTADRSGRAVVEAATPTTPPCTSRRTRATTSRR